MKLPKKLKMFGYDWRIKIVPDYAGGEYNWKTKTLTLGYKNGTKHELEEVLLHEIIEAVLTHLNFRFYDQEGSMEYEFKFNHTGLTQFHKTLFQVLKDNKLI